MTVGDPRVLAQVSCLSPTVRVTGHLLRREIIIGQVWGLGGPWDAFSCRARLNKCTKCGQGQTRPAPGVEAGRPALSPQQAQVTETNHAVVNVVISVETLGCVFPLGLATQGSDFHLLAHRACTIHYLQDTFRETSCQQMHFQVPVVLTYSPNRLGPELSGKVRVPHLITDNRHLPWGSKIH